MTLWRLAMVERRRVGNLRVTANERCRGGNLPPVSGKREKTCDNLSPVWIRRGGNLPPVSDKREKTGDYLSPVWIRRGGNLPPVSGKREKTVVSRVDNINMILQINGRAGALLPP